MGRRWRVRTRRDLRLTQSGALLTALMAWGCVSGPAAVPTPSATSTSAATAAASSTPAESRTPAITSSPFPTDDAFAGMVRTVSGGARPEGSQLELLWRGIMAGAHVDGQRPYQPPARFVGYRTGEIPDVLCADGTDARFWSQNAYYCRTDRTIAFDESWLRDLYARLGPSAAEAILAHEWGHSIQDMIGGQDYSIRNELQADCFAGMYIASAELAGVDPSRRDALGIALAAFFEIGNRRYDASAWFQAAEHGSPQQRILAYATGAEPFDEALPWCYGYRDFVPRDFTAIGPYRFLNLPGRSEHFAGDVYTIEPESRTGYASSGIRISWTDALPLAGQGATVEQLHRVASVRFPGSRLIADAQIVDTNVPRGSGVFQYFERATTGGAGSVESGVLGLVSPGSKQGGLTIVVHREQPAPTDPLDDAEWSVLKEEVVALFLVLARLCGPDDSPTLGPNLDTVCMDIQ